MQRFRPGPQCSDSELASFLDTNDALFNIFIRYVKQLLAMVVVIVINIDIII